MQLEAHMLRIADELHAAGLIPRLRQLPALTDEPQLRKLASREWAVLTRLLDGQRIPAIAATSTSARAPFATTCRRSTPNSVCTAR
jgi:DNA-binding NarL/FixJ family response regulator